MSQEKLEAAKRKFAAASTAYSDGSDAVNRTAEGLVLLVDAMIDIRRDIDAVKKFMEQRGRG